MRGPGVRLDLAVRRVWRCPACQRERRLAGDHTAVRCSCAAGVWMQIVSERVPIQRPVTSAEARELTVASFKLTEEELATPLPGRVRRRGPNPRTGPDAPGEATPQNGPPGPQHGPRDSKGPGGNDSSPPPRKPRPPRPPKAVKRPLSDIAGQPDEPSPPVREQPTPTKPVQDTDDFSAGIDVPAPTPES